MMTCEVGNLGDDDTPKTAHDAEPEEAFPVAGEPDSKGSYYYDDRTGYAIYQPEDGDDEIFDEHPQDS